MTWRFRTPEASLSKSPSLCRACQLLSVFELVTTTTTQLYHNRMVIRSTFPCWLTLFTSLIHHLTIKPFVNPPQHNLLENVKLRFKIRREIKQTNQKGNICSQYKSLFISPSFFSPLLSRIYFVKYRISERAHYI